VRRVAGHDVWARWYSAPVTGGGVSNGTGTSGQWSGGFAGWLFYGDVLYDSGVSLHGSTMSVAEVGIGVGVL